MHHPHVFPADPDFPQLRVATDLGRMLQVFRTHLRPVAGKLTHIEDCVALRLRSRQSRCVLQYTLRLLDPRSKRRWEQWVSGLLYVDDHEAERLWRELAAGAPQRDIPERWLTFEPVDFIPELRMLVQVFPYDRRLPNLCRALKWTQGDLEPWLAARLGPGRWRVEERRIEPTRYRTELGGALTCEIVARDGLTGKTETLHCYLKVYRDERGETTFKLMQSLSERGGTNPGYTVIRPVTYSSPLRTLVLEEAPGISLQQVLLGRDNPTPALHAAARAVAAFNRDTLDIARQSPRANQLADVADAARLIQWGCPELRGDVEGVMAAVIGGLADVTPAPIHGDLKTEHVFLRDDRVTFIDLDAAARGDPVRDPAHLFAHIAGRLGLDSLPAEQARGAAEALVEEYFRCVPASWRERFPLHAAAALLEVARGIFKLQEPDWRTKVRAAVTEARRVLQSA